MIAKAERSAKLRPPPPSNLNKSSAIHAWLAPRMPIIAAGAFAITIASVMYWRIVRGYLPIWSYVPFDAPPDWVLALNAWRWPVRWLVAGALAVLAYAEWAAQILSLWLRKLLENQLGLMLAIICAALLCGSYYLQPGHLASGDAMPHVGAVWVLGQSIKAGQLLPYWSNYAALGHPFLQFYSPLFYYLALLANLIFHNLDSAAQLVLLVTHVLAACAMYHYVRELTGSKPAGLVAALAWTSSFYHYHNAVALGKLPTALFIDLWPLQFYLIERLLAGPDPKRRSAAALALTIGAMLWTHMLYGGLAIVFGMVYAATRTLAPWPAGSIWRAVGRLTAVILAHLAGAFTALYYLIPVFAERQHVVGAPLEYKFLLPPVGVEGIFIFQGGYPASWFAGYVGNSIVAFGLLASMLIIVGQYHRGGAVFGQLCIAVFMAFAPYYAPGLFDAIFQNLPLGVLAYSIKSAGGYLIFVIGPVTALVGIGSYLLAELARTPGVMLRWAKLGLSPERIALVVAALLLFELVPLSLRVNSKYPDSYSGAFPDRQRIVELLARSPDPAARMIDANGSMYNWFYASMLTGHPSLIGHTPDTPRAFGVSIEQVVQRVADDARSGGLKPETAGLLYQLDIGYVITDAAISKINGLEDIARTAAAVLWRVPHHAPLVAAQAPATGSQMEVSLPQGGIVPVQISGYAVSATKVALNFSLRQRAFVQLAYRAYPFQQVLLDGRPVAVVPTALGLIGFWADAGSHEMQVTPQLSLLRQVTLLLSALAALLLFGVLLRSFYRAAQ